jgi:integrase
MLPANPLAYLPMPPRTSRGDWAIIGPANHAKLLAAAPPRFRDFLTLLHATGARPGEVARLTAHAIDWDAATATIREHKTADRTARPRVVWLSGPAVALLRPLAARHPVGPLLLNAAGRPWTNDALKAAMRKTRTRAGVPRAICYGYRHTFITDALELAPPAIVAELSGHTSLAGLKPYSHLATKRQALRDALGRVRPDAP